MLSIELGLIPVLKALFDPDISYSAVEFESLEIRHLFISLLIASSPKSSLFSSYLDVSN